MAVGGRHLHRHGEATKPVEHNTGDGDHIRGTRPGDVATVGRRATAPAAVPAVGSGVIAGAVRVKLDPQPRATPTLWAVLVGRDFDLIHRTRTVVRQGDAAAAGHHTYGQHCPADRGESLPS